MSVENVEKLIKDNQIEFIDLRFVDMRGVEQHVTFPVSIVEPSLFEEGKMFDGSSIAGWKGINESDMVLLPDPASAYVDPFYQHPTLVISCDILDPATMQPYGRCPRGIAKRAEAYLKSSGIAEQAFFGPEPEFFIFDSVQFANDMGAPATSSTAPTAATVRPSRAATSRSRRPIRCTTCALKCARRWNRSALKSKCSTTKWPPPASAKSAPSSAPWCRRPTNCCA
jgi:glutamine synthetase